MFPLLLNCHSLAHTRERKREGGKKGKADKEEIIRETKSDMREKKHKERERGKIREKVLQNERESERDRTKMLTYRDRMKENVKKKE